MPPASTSLPKPADLRWAGDDDMALRNTVLTSTIAIAVAGAIASPAYAQTARRYDLPAQDLGAALKVFAAVSGQEVVAATAVVAGKQSSPVHGNYRPDQAMAILLAKSGLRAKLIDGAYVIRPIADADASPTVESTEIVVTGTRIRGLAATSPVITLRADTLRDEGNTNLGEAVRRIPQSFGGGQNPGIGNNVPSASGVDVGGGSSINLRGLGSDATLTLLDGRRLAFSASAQSIDVSAIPFGALDRIEIVPDGASAIYGSDAVAGVANIILLRKFSGLEIGARLGAATDGGDFQQQYFSTGGLNWSGGSLVAAYDYGSNTAINAADRSYAAQRRPGLTLFPAMHHHSASIVADQKLTDTLTFSLDALFNIRWSAATFPTVDSGDLSQGRATFSSRDRSFAIAPSLKLALQGDWRLVLSGDLGRERVTYGQIECVVDACGSTGSGIYRNSTESAELGADGPLVHLPGGAAKVAIGLGYRNVGFERFADNGAAVNTRHRQDSYFAYGELALPLIAPSQAIPLVNRLNVTAAVRYERYPGIGGVATPKFGVIYAPSPDFDLKGSWGKSFRAPTLYQQYQPRTVVVFPPRFLGGSGYPATAGALLVIGGNPALKPERATTWSATLAVHPRSLEGARFEVSYFDVSYRDRIVAPISFLSQSLSSPLFASQITPNPSAAAQAAVIASAQTFLNITGVPYDPANVVAIVDNGSVNAGQQKAHGFDFLAEYRSRVGGDGTITASLDVAYLVSSQQLSSSQPTIPLAGRLFSPPHWRGQGNVSWSNGPLTLAATVDYTGGVDDSRTTPFVSINGMTVFGLTARYRTPRGRSALAGLEFSASLQNLFNSKPSPIDTSAPDATPYDSTNYSPVGRMVSLGISKRF